MEPMDPPQSKFSEDEDTSTIKVMKGVTCGLVAGTIVSTAVPRLRTLNTISNYGVTFASAGGIFVCVEQLMQNFRMKADIWNLAVGAGAATWPLLRLLGPSGRKLLFIPAVAAFSVSDTLLLAEATRRKDKKMKPEQVEDTPTKKIIKGAHSGLLCGTAASFVRALVSYAEPCVERGSAVRTLKMTGNFCLTFAAAGGICIGIEQLMKHYRMKHDDLNVAVGGLASILPLLGPNGRLRSSISLAYAVGGLYGTNFLINLQNLHWLGVLLLLLRHAQTALL